MFPVTSDVIQYRGDDVSAIVSRYILQSVVRSILPGSRTAKVCLRDPFVSADDWVSLKQYARSHGYFPDPGRFLGKEVTLKQTEHGSVFFDGLVRCGSVWACPPCAAKITEHRRGELKHLIDFHSFQGGDAILITRTIPHVQSNSLEFLLNRFKSAEDAMKNMKSYRGFLRSVGVLFLTANSPASVRAFEVTYTKNGWHVHVHEILFLEKRKDFRDRDEYDQFFLGLRWNLLAFWTRAVYKCGLNTPNIHGLHVRGGNYLSDYVAKWGYEPASPVVWDSASELTKQHLKRSSKGLAPFDFLRRCFVGDNWHVHSDLFQEYFHEFHGSKQLKWSKNLRSYCGLDSTDTDDEIFLEKEDEPITIGSFSWSEWLEILKKDIRGKIIDLAFTGGWPSVTQFLRA